ncbi:MAG: hypothetical protein AAB729_01265 [Patescibacteria group bacterium]
MSEVTLKAIENLLDKKLKPLDGKADRTAVLVTNLMEDLHEVPATLKSIVRTLDSHTAVLEQLLTKKKTKDEETVISAERFDRLEHWAFQVGKKLGIKLEL